MSTESLLQLLKEQDSAAVISTLCQETDPKLAAKSFLDLSRDLYWKQKDLSSTLAIARAGITYCLLRALDNDTVDSTLAYDLRSIVKGLCYDIASFTWNGWDEPGIVITTADLAAGFDAAKANLRLAHELKKGDLPRSRAHWILAGHYLSRSDRKSAADHYQQGERYAAAASSRPDELLNKAFAHLIDVLANPADRDAADRLTAIKSELKSQQDGQMFIDQLETAHRVFSLKR
jgi:hypothetical protein